MTELLSIYALVKQHGLWAVLVVLSVTYFLKQVWAKIQEKKEPPKQLPEERLAELKGRLDFIVEAVDKIAEDSRKDHEWTTTQVAWLDREIRRLSTHIAAITKEGQ